MGGTRRCITPARVVVYNLFSLVFRWVNKRPRPLTGMKINESGLPPPPPHPPPPSSSADPRACTLAGLGLGLRVSRLASSQEFTRGVKKKNADFLV